MLLVKPKRLLTDKELEEYLKLVDTPTKQKKYLDRIKEELFEEYELNRKNRTQHR